MKPTCKAEARWKYWREENPRLKHGIDKFSAWAKKQMRKARRRFLRSTNPQD